MELNLGLGLQTKLQNDSSSDENIVPKWTGEEKEMWQKWFHAIDPKVRRCLLRDNQLMIHGYIREMAVIAMITPLRVIELILFYYPVLRDLIVSDHNVYTLTPNDAQEYELILIGKNATLTTKWRKDWYAKLKCVQLIMDEGACIHVNELGTTDTLDNKDKIPHVTYDGIKNLKEIGLERGHAFRREKSPSHWTWFAPKRVGGGIIDIECKSILVMGHNANIVANGTVEKAYGGSIRVITSTLKMESTAKMEAQIDGKIIIGVEENDQSVIQMSNISPKPIFGKRIALNKDKWKITEAENDETAEKENEEIDDDAYWDNYFKNNSLI